MGWKAYITCCTSVLATVKQKLVTLYKRMIPKTAHGAHLEKLI